MENSRQFAITLVKSVHVLRQKTWDLYKMVGFDVRPISEEIKKKHMEKE